MKKSKHSAATLYSRKPPNIKASVTIHEAAGLDDRDIQAIAALKKFFDPYDGTPDPKKIQLQGWLINGLKHSIKTFSDPKPGIDFNTGAQRPGESFDSLKERLQEAQAGLARPERRRGRNRDAVAAAPVFGLVVSSRAGTATALRQGRSKFAHPALAALPAAG